MSSPRSNWPSRYGFERIASCSDWRRRYRSRLNSVQPRCRAAVRRCQSRAGHREFGGLLIIGAHIELGLIGQKGIGSKVTSIGCVASGAMVALTTSTSRPLPSPVIDNSTSKSTRPPFETYSVVPCSSSTPFSPKSTEAGAMVISGYNWETLVFRYGHRDCAEHEPNGFGYCIT